MIKICVSLCLFLSVVVVAVSSSSEPGVTINWGAYTNPLLDQNDSILKDQSLLQLIWDADGDGIDEPGENGIPSGGDRLLDISHAGEGSFFPGMVSRNATISGIKVRDQIYVRAWNGPDVGTATYYGDTRDLTPSLWRIENGLSLTLDATGEKPLRTDRLWSPQGMLLWRIEETYSTSVLHCGPNPCRDRLRITYSVPGRKVSGVSEDGTSMITHAAGSDRALVNVSMYDASGRLVRVVSFEERLPGRYSVEWDLRNESGGELPSGSYFVNLSIREGDGHRSSVSRKIVVVK